MVIITWINTIRMFEVLVVFPTLTHYRSCLIVIMSFAKLLPLMHFSMWKLEGVPWEYQIVVKAVWLTIKEILIAAFWGNSFWHTLTFKTYTCFREWIWSALAGVSDTDINGLVEDSDSQIFRDSPSGTLGPHIDRCIIFKPSISFSQMLAV